MEIPLSELVVKRARHGSLKQEIFTGNFLQKIERREKAMTSISSLGSSENSASGAPARNVVALDPGTANLVCAWEAGGSVKVSRLRNVFLEIPNDVFSRKMLGTLKVPEFEIDGKLYLAGNEAFELAKTFKKDLRRPMRSGVISSSEADAIPMLTRMVERLLKESIAKPGYRCAYSMPADPVDQEFDATFHRSVVEGMLKKNKLEPIPVKEGHAVVLSELADSDYTGIGLSWGGGMVNACAAFRSIPVIAFSSARAGDWIDEKAAQVCGAVKPRMTSVKESDDFDLASGNPTKEQAALISYYEAAIQYTMENIHRRFVDGKDMPDFSNPIDIVCAGGTASPKGFVEAFQRVFDRMKFPIPVKGIRVAQKPLYAVIRGCLVFGSM